MTPHFYIAARIKNINAHITFTFIENASSSERTNAWSKYCMIMSSHLPLKGKFGECIKVGPNNDIDAVKVSFNNSFLNAVLEEMYETTHRRSQFPKLLLHCTAKNVKLEDLTGTFVIETIYASTTGSEKSVVASLTHSTEL